MSIPDYQSIMLPLLKFTADKKEHSLREAIEYLANNFNLTSDEKSQLLPSGLQAVFDNRIGWARTYLKKAGLLESTRRAFFRITQSGLDALKKDPKEINVQFLEQYPEFVAFRGVSRKEKIDDSDDKNHLSAHETPEELLENAFQKIRQDLAQEILNKIKSCSPNFFERLVIELLVKMGYGGTLKDAGEAIGRSGDGGIDGIIKQDRLGLDAIYLQAKRWDGNVGRPEIQKFVGALHGLQAKKGVFITTSSFTSEALDYVSKIESKIVLIDGELLLQLMIDYDIGVSSIANYEVKKIDSDFFEDE